MKIVFASDIHLSAKESHSLNVFNEIVSLCDSNNIKYLILGGDVFDSFGDAENLIESFNEIISNSKIEKVLFLQGNHDIMGAGQKKLDNLNFDREKVKIFSSTPFEIFNIDNIEFLFIPFQKDSTGIFKVEVQKKSSKRFVIGHGSVVNYNSGDEEDDDYLSLELFDYLEADIVLLGHIHKRQYIGKVYYAGSARVWRSGEEGKHGVLIVDLESLKPTFCPIESGGEFITIDVELQDENLKFSVMPEEIKKNQWYKFKLHGCVTGDLELEKYKRKILEIFKDALHTEFDVEDVIDVSKYYENSLYKQFIEKWKSQYESLIDENEKEIYRLARRYFLEELSQFVLENSNDKENESG